MSTVTTPHPADLESKSKNKHDNKIMSKSKNEHVVEITSDTTEPKKDCKMNKETYTFDFEGFKTIQIIHDDEILRHAAQNGHLEVDKWLYKTLWPDQTN